MQVKITNKTSIINALFSNLFKAFRFRKPLRRQEQQADVDSVRTLGKALKGPATIQPPLVLNNSSAGPARSLQTKKKLVYLIQDIIHIFGIRRRRRFAGFRWLPVAFFLIGACRRGSLPVLPGICHLFGRNVK